MTRQRRGTKKPRVGELEVLRTQLDRLQRDPYRVQLLRCSQQQHASRQNCADNPNCLFGLGERKEGLWKTPIRKVAAIAALGADPRRCRTSSASCSRASRRR